MIRGGIKFKNLNHTLYSIRVNNQSVSYKFEEIQKETSAYVLMNTTFQAMETLQLKYIK